MSKPPVRPRRQRGMTLFVALIMLVMLTMLALTSFNVGKSNLQIVTNMQQRTEALSAATQLIDEAISNTKFYETPGFAIANPCGAANTRCIDSNGDGINDITATLVVAGCVKVRHIKSNELSLENADGTINKDDLSCSVSENQSTGVEGAVTGDSLCSNSVWHLTSTAVDSVTEATVQVDTGISVRVLKDVVETSCP